jgi:tetratricopeptide (TPR) repeat protein
MAKQSRFLGAVLIMLALAPIGCSRELRLSTSSPEAVKAYDQGVTEWERFYYSEAEASLKRAIAADSTFAAAWARLAYLHANLGNDADARRESAHAIALSAHATQREQLLVRLLRYRTTYDNTRASAVAESLFTLYPDEPEAYLVRGQLYEQEKNLEAAIEMYERAVDADTGFAPAVMNLGYAYSNLGEQDKAVDYMQQYIRMAPGVADPRASYADVLSRAGRYADALEQYRASLQLKPDYWYSVGQIGRVYALLGRLKEATQELDRSFEMVPKSSSVAAQRLRAHAYIDLQRGSFEEAVRQCHESITLDSSVTNAAFTLSYALARLKRFPEAHEVIDEMLRELREKKLTESTAMLTFHLMRARVLLEEHQFDEAQEACTQALEFCTPLTRGPVYVQLARILLATHEYESALDAIEAALGVNPNAPDALLVLAKVYHEQGDAEMTAEVGARLSELWKDADADFLPAIELHALLGSHHTHSSP